MFRTIITAVLITLMSGNAAVSRINTLGGYTPVEETAVSETNDAEYQGIFDEAMSKHIGCSYETTQMIEKQIVNGTNYKFIAKAVPVYPGAKTKTVQVTIHESLDGEISVLEIREL